MDHAPGQIHGTDPFATPAEERDAIRRVRGRLAGPVTLWTASAGGERAGLTVSSVLVVAGEPGLVVGVVNEDSDFWDVLGASGRCTVQILEWPHRALADEFAGVRPAPGGPFRDRRWRETPWGPVLDTVATWVGCRLRDRQPVGHGRLVTAVVEEAVVGELPEPLLWQRGRYRRLAD